MIIRPTSKFLPVNNLLASEENSLLHPMLLGQKAR